MPNPSLNPFEVMDMLGKIYENSSQKNNSSKLEQKFATQQEHLNRLKVENDAFFNLINQLFAQKLELDRLRAALLDAAQEQGFDNIAQALNHTQNSFGQSPLQRAFQEQDFSLAKHLMDFGAEVRPIEKAAFEMALDSKAAKEAGFASTATADARHHPVKRFGLSLGIVMTASDGTFSQLSNIAPAYKLMTDSVASYANNNPGNDNFRKIADAYSFSNKTSAYSGSTAKNLQAGEQMAERIQSGKLTTIPIACKGHCMGLSIVPDGPGSKSGYMVFTNRGVGCNDNDCGTQIYRIDDLKKVDPKFINAVMNGHSNGTSHADIMKMVHRVADNKPPITHIPQQAQKYDNCSVANSRANIRGILLCQKAIEKNGFDNLSTQDHRDVKASYKDYSKAMRVEKVNELMSEIANNPQNPDLINLGKEYLKQHPKAPPEVREKLEKAIERGSKEVAREQRYEPPQMSSPG